MHSFDWNVVVIGRWNRAIYTPQGIVTRLFEQPPGIEFPVEVPADSIGPYKVFFDDLAIVVDWSRFMVSPLSSDYTNLRRAMDIAVRAMSDLPETPLSASGFNIRYRCEAGCPGPSTLDDALNQEWDSRLSAESYHVSLKALTRGFEWRHGRILLSCSEEDGGILLHVNFERKGDRKELREWLQIPADDIREEVERLATRVLGLERGTLQ